MREVIDWGFDRLAAVEGRYLAISFFGLLLIYTLALVWQAIGYSEAARLFPLIVGVPLVAMLVANILVLAFEERIDLRQAGFFDSMTEFESESVEIDEGQRYRREMSMIGWVVGLIGLTWLFGNLAAVAIFVFAFVSTYERAPIRAGFVTAVTTGFIYLLFVVVLDAALYRGIIPLGGWLP